MFNLLIIAPPLLAFLIPTARSAVGVITYGTPIITGGTLAVAYPDVTNPYPVYSSNMSEGAVLETNGPNAALLKTQFSFFPTESAFQKNLRNSATSVFGHVVVASDSNLEAFVMDSLASPNGQDIMLGLKDTSNDSGQLLYYWCLRNTTGELYFVGAASVLSSTVITECPTTFAITPFSAPGPVTFASQSTPGAGKLVLNDAVPVINTSSSASSSTSVSSRLASSLSSTTMIATSTSSRPSSSRLSGSSQQSTSVLLSDRSSSRASSMLSTSTRSGSSSSAVPTSDPVDSSSHSRTTLSIAIALVCMLLG